MLRLVEHRRWLVGVAHGWQPLGREGAVAEARRQAGPNLGQREEAAFDTGDFDDRAGSVGNLGVDDVLPSADLTVCASGVFWPTEEAGPEMNSDHRLVWVDVALPGQGCPSGCSNP